MRLLTAVLLAAALAGCASGGNPYDTGDLASDLEDREQSVKDMEHAELAQRMAPQDHDYQAKDHELSDWRAAVLDKSHPEELRRMKSESQAKIAELEVRVKDLEARPAPVGSSEAVTLRRQLALERAKLDRIEKKIRE